MESSRCLVVMETVEAMAEGAANALLKTLEEPGDGMLILLTASPDRLLSTIRSRCQSIPFGRLDPQTLEAVLQRHGHGGITHAGDPPELLELAAGSPGALLEQRAQWQALPEGLTDRCSAFSAPNGAQTPMVALSLARDLCEVLDVEQQLWLLDWWQLHLWRQRQDPAPLKRLEQLRSHLRSYVQPRLAWEVALLSLAGVGSGRA